MIKICNEKFTYETYVICKHMQYLKILFINFLFDNIFFIYIFNYEYQRTLRTKYSFPFNQ